MAADAAFDLSAKLGFDTSKLQSSVSNAVSLVNKFQQSLTALGQSQQTTGLGQVLRLVVAVGEMAKKTFGNDIPQSVGKARMSLNELASSLGAVKNQIRGVGTESTKAGQTFTASFKQAATAANQAAAATKRAGDSLREGMAAAERASSSAGREMVLVGRAADQMSNQVVAASGRAAMAVAQMAMTVQRARQMISGGGGGGMVPAGFGGGAMTQGFGVQATGFTPNAPSSFGGYLAGPYNANAAFRTQQAANRANWNGNANAFAQYIQSSMQGRGIGAMSSFAGGLQSASGAIAGFGSGAVGAGVGGAISSGLAAAYSAATAAVRSFESAVQRAMSVAVSGMQNLTKAAGAAALVLGTIAGTSVNISAGFEQSMARVKAVTNATEADFKSMRDEANRLGIATQFSARQAADAMGFLGLAGYKANDIIKAMPATLDLAAAGMMDTARSADIMAKIMAGMQLETDQLGKVTDILAQAFTNANTDLSQLGEAMKYVGPVGHAANKSLEEVTATLMVLGNNGYQASLGGTALRNILSHLAQNGKQVEAVMSKLNVKINDASGYMRPLADIIDDMRKSIAKQGIEAETTGLVMKAFGERAGPAMAALLAEGGDEIRRYTALLEQSAGTGQRIAEIQRNTFSGHWELLKSTVEQFQIILGDAIGKDLRKLIDSANEWLTKNTELVNTKLVAAWEGFRSVMSGAADAATAMYQVAAPIFADLYDKAVGLYQGFMAWFETLPEGTQNAIKIAAALTALGVGLQQVGAMIPLVGPLASALGSLINPLTALHGAFSMLLPLIGVGGSIAAALVSLTAAILSLAVATGPIGLLIAALVGAGGLVVAITNGTLPSINDLGDGLKDRLASGFEAAKSAAAGFFSLLKGEGEASLGSFKIAAGHIADMLGLKGTGAQLRAEGEAEVQGAKSGPKLSEKRVSKYGETGARHFEVKDQAERDAIAASDRLRAMEKAKAENPYAYQLAGGDEELQRRRDRHSQAQFAKKRATERANDPAVQFRARETDYENKLKANPGAAAARDTAEEAKLDEISRKALQDAARKKRIAEGGEAFDAGNLTAGNDFLEMAEKAKKGELPLPAAGAAGASKAPGQAGAGEPVAVNENGQPVDFFGRPIKNEAAWMKKGKTTPPSQDVLKNGFGNTPFMNLLQNRVNTSAALGFQGQEARTAMAGVRGTVTGQLSPEEQQGMQALSRFGQQIMNQIKLIANLDGEEKQKQIKALDDMQKQFFGFTAAVQNGKTKLSDLAKELQKAAAVTKEATEAEKEKELNAKGQLSPRQQQAQQQAHQAAQQMAQGIQQALGMANEQSKAIWNGVFGGAEQVQAMIDQAVATGNTKAATDLIRGRLQAQLKQSQLNMHLLGTSTILGNFNADNSTFQMTKDTPIANMIRFLQDQLAKLPRMASGGIVTGATQAVVGEAGPEAVLPLTKFTSMLGSLPVFQGIQQSMEKLGTWFSQGGTVGFGNMRGGNNPGLAARYFNNLAKVQHTFDYAMDRMWNSRRVDFTPASMAGGPMGNGYAQLLASGGRMAYGAGSLPFGVGGYAGNMMGIGNVHLNFHGVDISAPGAAVAFAQQLFPALDAEARRTGYSMMGNSMLRAGGSSVANRAYGYAR